MPVSILQGRPTPAPGEPLFTEEDTAWAIALAEEERDACPACGFPRSVCRDASYQFAFEPHEEMCHATARLAQYRESDSWKGKLDTTRAATQVTPIFREGHEAPIDVGLDLRDVQVD